MDTAAEADGMRRAPGPTSTTGTPKPKRKPVPARSSAPTVAPPSWDTVPHAFLVLSILFSVLSSWGLRWFLSGAPFLIYCMLLGESHGYRILPYIPIWAIFSTLNLIYVVSSTSWLLYWTFLVFCWPSALLSSLFQFYVVADIARWAFRKLLQDLHFINDKIAFFNLPGLEFDTKTNGLMVIRGATLSLSTLTLVAHGVEVGVKVSEDIELAIQVDKVTVPLFRTIEIDDVYANVKGGDWEMTFGTLDPEELEKARQNEAFLAKETPIIRAATMALDNSSQSSMSSKRSSRASMSRDKIFPAGFAEAREAFKSVEQVSPKGQSANKKYEAFLRHIADTSTIKTTIDELMEIARREEGGSDLDLDDLNDLRAAIAGQLQPHASVPHPPTKTIRLSTLRKTSYPNFKRFLHRLPLLYRLLLNPIAYFHPIKVKSVTAAGSGKWFKFLMQQYFFKHYPTQDPDIRRLEARISAWVADANFAVELVGLDCTAQVPVNTAYDIETHFRVKDVMAYRTLPGGVAGSKQIVRIGGADGALSMPLYLFPHHEHLFPPKPTAEDVSNKEQEVNELKDTPQGVQLKTALKRLRRDEAIMRVSAHAHLPARFNQDLLNFIAAIVKATKVIETDQNFEEMKTQRALRRTSVSSGASTPRGSVDKELATPRGSVDSDAVSVASDASTITTDPTMSDPNSKNFKAFLKKVDTGLKNAGVKMGDGMRKAGLNTASAVANDRWIAKLVGKVVRKLEKAQGEVGYSANVPLQLQEWRESEKWEDDAKILP